MKNSGSPGGLLGNSDTLLTGENTNQGVSMYGFFKNFFTKHASGGLITADQGIKACYEHATYVKIVSLSAAGTEVEE